MEAVREVHLSLSCESTKNARRKYGKLVSFYVPVVGKITCSSPPCSKMVKNLELEHVL